MTFSLALILFLVGFIAGAVLTALFGKTVYAKAHQEAVDEIHAVEARWARLIVNLKSGAKKAIDKV